MFVGLQTSYLESLQVFLSCTVPDMVEPLPLLCAHPFKQSQVFCDCLHLQCVEV